MVRLESTIKVADNAAQHHDPQLATQTPTAYFYIRKIPSTTTRILTTQQSLLEHPTDSDNGLGGTRGLSKSVIEYILLSLLIFGIICIILRRFWCARNRQQSAFPSASQRYRNITRQVELQPLHPDGHPYPDPFLREIPAAHIHPSRRTRARDIDSSGRRQDIPAETDHDGELGANDALPAYDNFGGPPKYFELDTLSRNRPPESGVTQRPDASWENININSSENVGVHTPVGTTPASNASQHDTSRPTPPYSENLNRSSNDRSP